MKKNKKGFIKISKDFIDHPLYSGSDAFNLKEVLIDLTLRAFYTDVQKTYRGQIRYYQRGQVEGSIRQFAEWWNMTKDTATKRLQVLEENGFIYVEKSNLQTVVTLRNYCKEQDFFGLGSDTDLDTDSDTNQDTHYDTESDTDSDNLKKSKEKNKKREKKEKKESSDFVCVRGKRYEE